MAVPSTSLRARCALAALVAGYAATAAVASAPASPLAPPLPPGVHPASWLARAARGLGLAGASRLTLTVVSLAVLVALVAAFAVAVVEAWGGRVSPAAVAVAGGAALVVATLAPVLLSRDVFSYAAYGRMWVLHGSNPYSTPPSAFPADPFFGVISPAWRGTRSVYGPVFTLVSAAAAKLWRSPGDTLLAFKALSAGATAGAAWFAARAAVAWGLPTRAAAAAALVALNPVIVVHTVGGAHNDALVALSVAAAAFLAAPPARPTKALGVTAVLTLGALVKVVVAIPLVLWLVWLATKPDRGKRGLAAGHLGVAVAIALAASAPVFGGWRTVTAMANLASRQGWASGARLMARGAGAIGGAVAGSGGRTVGAAFVYAAFLAVFVAVLWRLARAPSDRPPSDWGAALLVFALAAPYLLPWYAAWFVPLLALVDDRVLVAIGVAAACLLALTGVPAEPGSAPSMWRDMILAVHYGAAPAMLVGFGLAVRRIAAAPHRLRAPAPGGRRVLERPAIPRDGP